MKTMSILLLLLLVPGVLLAGIVSCSCNGTVEPIEVTYPANLDFGDVDVGDSATLDWIIKHNGPAGARNLTGEIWKGPLCDPDFTFPTDLSPYDIAPFDSLIVPITVVPIVPGGRTCDIENGLQPSP